MRTLLHDATIITPIDAELRVLPHHSLVFDEGRVRAMGPADGPDLRGDAAGARIDGRNAIVVPGLVNTHHHLYQSLTRCLPAAQNRRLFHWLRALYPPWRTVDYAAIRLAAQVSIAELLLHGCTTTVDHFYLFPPGSDVRVEAVIAAADSLGIRLHLGRGAMTLGASRGGLPPDNCVESDADVLADCQRVLDHWHDPAPYAMRRIDLAPCSPFNVTPELLRDTRDLARGRKALLHTHLAETLDEESFCLERYGCRPVQLLADLDWLGPDVYLAHCVHLNDDEIARFAQTQTGVSHNPTSNFRLASGVAPVEKLLRAGVRVGLGVDGSSSNDGGNLLVAARDAVFAARTRVAAQPAEDQTDELFSARAAFGLATTGGAACLQRPELGHLNPGAAADFAMFRSDDIALAGAVAHDPLAALVLCAAPRADRVFVAGREVVHDGHLVARDERLLAEQLNAHVRRHFG